MNIFLMGYHYMDFPDSNDPTRRIRGYNLYLAQEAKDVVGVMPVSKDGKRFLSAAKANELEITNQWLDDHIDSFIDIDINFDGKIVDIRDFVEAADEKKSK